MTVPLFKNNNIVASYNRKLTIPIIMEFIEKNYNNQNNNNLDLEIDFNEMKYNISKNINFMKDIFNIENLARIGVLHKFSNNLHFDISLISSVLTLLNKDFLLKNTDEQTIYIKYIYNLLKNNVKHNFNKKNINQIIDNLNEYNFTDPIITLLSKILFINIFIIEYTLSEDIDTNTKSITGKEYKQQINSLVIEKKQEIPKPSKNNNFKIKLYCDDGYIPYKKNIFLIKLDDNSYEPLFFNNNTIIDYNNEIIKNLKNIKIYTLNNIEENELLSLDLNNINNIDNDNKLIELYLKENKNIEKKLNIRFDISDEKENLEKKKYLDNQIENNKNLKISLLDSPTETNNFEDQTEIIDNNGENEDTKLDIIDVEKSVYNKKDLTKLKLNQLQEKALEHKIDIKIGKKNKTKQQLIDELLEI
jgi:hypothetical protein